MKRKDSKAAGVCGGCPLARNTINGLYCTRLRLITEYMTTKPCNP